MSSIRDQQKEFLLSLYERKHEIHHCLHRLAERTVYEKESLIQTESAIAALEEELNKIQKEDE